MLNDGGKIMKKKLIVALLLLLIINIEGREKEVCEEGVYFLWKWPGYGHIEALLREEVGPFQIVYVDREGNIHYKGFLFVILVPEGVNIRIEKTQEGVYVYFTSQKIISFSLDPELTRVPPAREIFVFPNPWKKKDGKQGVIFKGLPKNATVEIFNVAGERIAKFHTSATDDEAFWVIPEKLASGVYIYLITGNEGGKTIGKLAIIK